MRRTHALILLTNWRRATLGFVLRSSRLPTQVYEGISDYDSRGNAVRRKALMSKQPTIAEHLKASGVSRRSFLQLCSVLMAGIVSKVAGVYALMRTSSSM